MKKLAWSVWLLLVVAAAFFAAGVYRDRYPDAEVARLAESLQLRPGMTVAEVGAGKGRMAIRIARYLGAEGQVYATELEGPELEELRESIVSAGASNITVIQAGEMKANLPPQCCDAVFMSKVYHHFTHPASMNRGFYEALRSGGRLAVIDFEPRFWRFWLTRPDKVPENRLGHGMPLKILIDELTASGFAVEQVADDWWSFPEQRYCVLVRKPEKHQTPTGSPGVPR